MAEFLSYIHRLRGVAILFVVGVHARGGISDWLTHESSHRFAVTLFDAHEGNGTVMFLFIGGFLFQHLNQRGFLLKKYLANKFKLIILPYILISIPLIIWRIKSGYSGGGLPEGFDHFPIVFQFLYYVLFGSHLAPFWFIAAIILFYLTAPVFVYIDKPWFYKWCFPVLLVAGLFTYRPYENANPFLAYVHYLPVYIGGMMASRYKRELLSTSNLVLGLMILTYCSIFFFEFNAGDEPKRSFEEVVEQGVLIFNIYYFRALLLCIIGMLVLHRLVSYRMPVLEVLGDYSFGIFFVHFLIIMMARKALEVMAINVDFSLLSFTAFYIGIVVASTGIVFLVKKLTGSYSRNLIGS